MQHLGTDTRSPGPCRHKEEQTVFVHVPLMTRAAMTHNSRIPTFEGNSVSCVQVNGSRNMSYALAG